MVAGPKTSRSRGRDWGVERWQETLRYGSLEECKGPWCYDAEAIREARVQGWGREPFLEGARHEWRLCQWDWMRDEGIEPLPPKPVRG